MDYIEMIKTGIGFPINPCVNCHEQKYSGVPCSCTKMAKYVKASCEIPSIVRRARNDFLKIQENEEKIMSLQQDNDILKLKLFQDWDIEI